VYTPQRKKNTLEIEKKFKNFFKDMEDFKVGDAVLVRYDKQNKWFEAVLKEKKKEGWDVIWTSNGKFYGTTTDKVKMKNLMATGFNKKKSADIADMTTRIDKILSELSGLNLLTKRNLKEWEKSKLSMQRRMEDIFKPFIFECQTRMTRLELALDRVICNQEKILERLPSIDSHLLSTSWETFNFGSDHSGHL
jgi:hypothetical protein